MAQDFAKKGNAGTPRKRKTATAATRKETRPPNHWSWFFTGLFSGFFITVVAWLGYGSITGNLPEAAAVTGQAGPRAGSQEETTSFDFYEYLPEAEVQVNVVPVEIAANTPGAEAKPTTYLLQVGSSQNRESADALRARVILLGMDARIVPAVLSGRTWYRVQAGPFVGRASVETAEDVLITNNIDPMRLKIPTP